MSRRVDGGPAFPHSWDFSAAEGMTLRDYFAAAAVQGYLASFGDDASPSPTGVARTAYKIADAMLAARNGGA